MSAVAPGALLPLISAGDDPFWLPPSSPDELIVPQAPFHTLSNQLSIQHVLILQTAAWTHISPGLRLILTSHLFKTMTPPSSLSEESEFILSGGGSRAQFYRDLYPDHLEERLLNLTSWHQDRAIRCKHQEGLHRIYFTQPEKFRASAIAATGFGPPSELSESLLLRARVCMVTISS